MDTSAFRDLTPEHFPFTIEYYNKRGQILYRTLVEGPGVVHVPGQKFFREPIGVRMLWPRGLVTETPPGARGSTFSFTISQEANRGRD